MSGLFSGSVNIAAQIGLESILIRPMRGITLGNEAVSSSSLLFIPQVTIEEDHLDVLSITDHPVEYGSNITDHSFKHPAELVLKYGWSNSPTPSLADSVAGLVTGAIGSGVATIAGLAQSSLSGFNIGTDGSGIQTTQVNKIYDQLVQLQASRILFAIYTGKRFYQDMLIQQLRVETDYTTENALIATLRCRQVIIAKTSVQSLPQADPADTGPVVSNGTNQLVQR